MGETKDCPECGEAVAFDATTCVHCQAVFDEEAHTAEKGASLTPRPRKVSCLASMAAVGCAFLAVASASTPYGGLQPQLAPPAAWGFAAGFVLAVALMIWDAFRDPDKVLMPISFDTAFISVAVVTVIASIAIPNLIHARGGGSSGTSTIGALKTIGTAQSLFREADREGDGNLDYGTLQELGSSSAHGLIDSILASGTKYGYLFEATYGSSTSEFLWFATANPQIQLVTGDRYFCANHEGVTFYSFDRSFELNSVNCTVPAWAIPVGK